MRRILAPPIAIIVAAGCAGSPATPAPAPAASAEEVVTLAPVLTEEQAEWCRLNGAGPGPDQRKPEEAAVAIGLYGWESIEEVYGSRWNGFAYPHLVREDASFRIACAAAYAFLRED